MRSTLEARGAQAAPKDSSDKQICLEFSSLKSCQRSDCRYSHQKLTSTASLDYTTIVLLINRGGLMASPFIPAEKRAERANGIMEQARKEKSAKITDG